MRRREFIGLVGGAATLPLAAHAQQPTGTRRIGALLSTIETDSEGQARVGVLRQGLKELGWIEGRNIHIDYRWAGGNPDLMRAHATELVGLSPDAILAAATTALVALQRATRRVPIVFAQVTDPVAAGFVESLKRFPADVNRADSHWVTDERFFAH